MNANFTNVKLKNKLLLVFGLASVFLLFSCRESPKLEERRVKVTIVRTQEVDSLLRYGKQGVTTIELEDGTRRQVGGVLGEVGETFRIDLHFKR